MGLEVRRCVSPPVTFSTLCEIYELLQEWHVDAPLEVATLADAAIDGLGSFASEETEEPPRTLFCAIPDQAFTRLCEELATRVTSESIPVGEAVEAATSHMIDVVLGPFTYYLPPEAVGSFRNNGIVGGIGVVLDARDAAGSRCTQIGAACRLEVVAVIEGNPAFDSGLAEGDVIVSVDGTPVDGMGFTAVVAALAGDETGIVAITVERNGSPLDFEMERAPLVVPTVEVELPSPDVGYLKIPDFEMDIPGLVAEGLEELAGADVATLVLDLRDNPGGFVDSVVAVADEFMDDGLIMTADAPDSHREFTAEPGGLATGQRLVVMVNQGTASAAEILTGALSEQREALIVGTSTFGKDAVQIPFPLRNGGELYVTIARWSTPSGETAANGGLTPHRVVSWPPGASVAEVVEIALDASS